MLLHRHSLCGWRRKRHHDPVHQLLPRVRERKDHEHHRHARYVPCLSLSDPQTATAATTTSSSCLRTVLPPAAPSLEPPASPTRAKSSRTPTPTTTSPAREAFFPTPSPWDPACNATTAEASRTPGWSPPRGTARARSTEFGAFRRRESSRRTCAWSSIAAVWTGFYRR